MSKFFAALVLNRLTVRKINYSKLAFFQNRIMKVLKMLIPILILYSFLFFGVSILFFYLSTVIEESELETSLSEFLYGEKMSFIDSYALNIKLTFTGQMPSFTLSPLVFSDFYSTIGNSMILLVLSIIFSVIIAFMLIILLKNIKSRKTRHFAEYVFGLDRVLSPILILSLLTSILIASNKENIFIFSTNDPTTWILPVVLIATPMSNYMYRLINKTFYAWRRSGEREMFYSLSQINHLVKVKYMWTQGFKSTFKSILLLCIGAFILQLLVELAISFNGIGRVLVENIITNEIWLNLALTNTSLLIIFGFLFFTILFSEKSILKRQ